MENILIATILPNGISGNEESGKINFQFSLCIDLNTKLNLDELKLEDLQNLLFSLQKSINSIFNGGFEILIDEQIYKVESKDLQPVCDINKLYEIRNNVWNKLFRHAPNESNIVEDIQVRNIDKIENFIDDNLLDDPMNTFREFQVSNYSALNVPETNLKVNQLKNIYGEDLNLFFKSIKGINAFSQKQAEKQNYFSQLSYKRLNATNDLTNSISKEMIYDTFSILSENSLFLRISGLIIDFNINEIKDKSKFLIKYLPSKDDEVPPESWITPGSYMVISKSNTSEKRLLLLEGQSEDCCGIYSSLDLMLKNHDLVAKNYTLKKLFEELGTENITELKEEKQREFINAIKRLDTSITTNGLNVYHKNWKQQVENGKFVDDVAEDSLTSKMILKEQNLIKGQRIGIKQNNLFTSVGLSKYQIFYFENNKYIPVLERENISDFAVSTDTGMLSLDEENGNISQLVDGCLMNWTGDNLSYPSIFANKEDEENLEPKNDDGSISESSKICMERIATIFEEIRFPYNTSIRKKGISLKDDAVIINEIADVNPLVKINYSPIPGSNPKLIFGNTYELILVNEYKNGWAIPFKKNTKYQMNVSEYIKIIESKCSFPIPSFTFRRNEPVAPVALFLKNPLFDESGNKVLKGRDGESLHHLVIRSTGISAGDIKSYRHILPPQISFKHALWHGEIFKMEPDESFDWYKRYMSSEGIRMPEYIKNGNASPNYLPDPLCIGFRIRFYLDKDLNYPATDYYYEEQNFIEYLFKTGKYPKVKGCLLILDYYENLSRIEKNEESITIRLSPGEELFAEIRSVLSINYEEQMEVYGGKAYAVQHGENDYITPPKVIRLTHATQKPLISPEIVNIFEIERRDNSGYLGIEADVHFEQLNLYKDIDGRYKYMDNSLPSGDIELFSKWEKFVDDPDQILSSQDLFQPVWTPEQPILEMGRIKDFVLDTILEVKDQLIEMSLNLSKRGESTNNAENFMTRVKFIFDTKMTKYHKRHIIIKNKSTFAAYFPNDAYQKEYQEESKNLMEIVILNTQKPGKPSVNRIIPLLVTDDVNEQNSIIRTNYGNRFRIYLNRGRLTSGEGERLGILIFEPESEYSIKFNDIDQLSISGRDYTANEYLPFVDNEYNNRVNLSRFNIQSGDPTGLKDKAGNDVNDLNKFKEEYISSIGCVTYLPKFDTNENLWFVDLEIDIDSRDGNSLHTPFFQLALVHYQPNSKFKKGGFVADIVEDFRISEIEKSPFIYLLPKRIVSLYWSDSVIKIGLTVNKESLLSASSSRKTFFIASVQYSKDDVIWKVASRSKDGKESFSIVQIETQETTEIEYKRSVNNRYRVLLVELEAFDVTQVESSLNFDTIIESRTNRIILINTFKI